MDEAHIKTLPALAQAYIAKHAFLWKGEYYLCGDLGQFTNHSETPNSKNWPNSENLSEVASHDIKKGEEITADYRNFDEASREKLRF